MQTLLGGKQGKSSGGLVLRSLVKANAVSVRPFSPSFPAKDIPLEVRFFSLISFQSRLLMCLQLQTNDMKLTFYALSNRSGGMVKQPSLQHHLFWPSIA